MRRAKLDKLDIPKDECNNPYPKKPHLYREKDGSWSIWAEGFCTADGAPFCFKSIDQAFKYLFERHAEKHLSRLDKLRWGIY